MTTTQNVKLLRRLSSGKNLTVAEAKSRYGIGNLSARIHELREAGFRIFTNKVKMKGGSSRGRIVTAYRLHVESSKTLALLSAGIEG
jgi:hypothetical protein